MKRVSKITRNGLRKEVIKLAAQGMRARAIATKINETRKKKDKINYQVVGRFLNSDKKAKQEILQQEKELAKESVKYTINVQKQLFESNKVARHLLFKLVENKEKITAKERLIIIPKYLKSIDDQLKLQAQLLGDINPESNVTINFNNVYVEFKTVVFKILKKYPKILKEIKIELEGGD